MSIITSTITSGITLGTSGNYTSPLIIESYGAVETFNNATDGIYGPSTQAWAVYNYGTVLGLGEGYSDGIDLRAGGSVVNGDSADTTALISGYRNGVYIAGGAGSVANYGTISCFLNGGVVFPDLSGVALAAGGSVTNGAGGASTALISGAQSGVDIGGGAGTVANFATITGLREGVYLGAGGSVTNGASGASTALISGGLDGVSGPNTVVNFGTISGPGESGGTIKVFSGIGVAAGSVINGTGTASTALIYGLSTGVSADTVANFGTISSDTSSTLPGVGVYLVAGADVVNGASGATGALISGGSDGVYVSFSAAPAATVANYGIISGGVFGVKSGRLVYGMGMGPGVSVINGASGATAALISGGDDGVVLFGTAAGTVANYATITGALYNGVYLGAGGSVTNGAGGVSTALISGLGDGVYIGGAAGTVANFSAIRGIGGASNGVVLVGGSVTNGAGSASTALISGVNVGVAIGGGGAVANYGTIIGSSVYGVHLGAGGSVTNGAGGASAALISGYFGVAINYGAGTVDNFATISGTAMISGTLTGDGVFLNLGGSVVNGAGGASTALISSYKYGVRVNAAAGTVANYGIIEGSRDDGVYFYNTGAGDSVTNGSGSATAALISGGQLGVFITGGAGTVANYGTITGTGSYSSGVDLAAGGSVTNGASGASAALISGHSDGVTILGSAGAVTNFATISGDVHLDAGGGVVNGANGATGALISGGADGVVIVGAAGTVANYGNITGASIYGVRLFAGGSVTNGASGASAAQISGGSDGGVAILGSAGTVANFGAITGVQRGVWLRGGFSTVANSGTIAGTGTSGIGAYLAVGGVIIDSGTINGAGGTAVYFGGIGPNLLGLAAGYKLTGAVVGGISATNTLELLGSLGAAVSVDVNALHLSNFQDALFGPGGHDTLKVSSIGGTLGVTISGFNQGSDVIDLTQIGANGTISNFNGLTLSVTGSLGSETLLLDATDATLFSIGSDGATGTDITPACFARGTLIATPDGEVPVEALAAGDLVETLAGEARPIRWVGHSAYDGRFIAGNRAVLPICVTAGALADGVPARDLYLSPEHSLYLDGALAQAKHLVNGMTIVQAESVDEIEYFHLELDSHDIVVAEGAAAESYVDCDNRLMFDNGAEYAARRPDDDRPRWAFCAPRLAEDSPELAELREALLWRAEAQGHALDPDPDFHLVVDDAVIAAEAGAGGGYRFALPAGCRSVRLVSRSCVPTEIGAASRDTRRLGVAVERLTLSDGDLVLDAWHGHPALAEGFHSDEATHRWTNGCAWLPAAWLRLFPGSLTLDVRLVPSPLGYRGASPNDACAAA